MTLDLRFIDRLTEVVRKNISNPNFGVSDLTRLIGISHSSLHRKLKSSTGQSISQFIREIRLKRAMELLKTQDSTVAEVAYEAGFGSNTYFAKCFHEYYGFPPAEIRKRYSSNYELFDGNPDLSIPINPYRTVAVLPFENNTGDKSLDFLVYGLHEELIGELGQLKTIRVVSKTSVHSLALAKAPITELTIKEDIDYIIKASVQTIDEKVRIRLRLIRALLDEQLWEQTFEVSFNRILALYGQIVREVANKIEMILGPGQQVYLAERREVNPECYKEYLRGRYYLYQLTEEGMRKGIACLLDAIRKDPAEPFAYAGLALGYIEIAHGPLNPGDAYEKAEWAAEQALKLAPSMAEAQLALAEVYMYSTWEYEKSENHFTKALELNPNLSLGHYHYSWLLYLMARYDEAVYEHLLAQRYDPFNPMITAFTGLIYAYTGRFEEAFNEVNKSFEIQKDCPDGYFVLQETFTVMGKETEALNASKKLAEADPVWKWVLGYSYAMTDHKEEARRILNELLEDRISSWTAMGIAVIHGALGNLDEAFKWVKYEPHHAWIPWISVMPMGKSFRSDKRFMELVRHWNIPEQYLSAQVNL